MAVGPAAVVAQGKGGGGGNKEKGPPAHAHQGGGEKQREAKGQDATVQEPKGRARARGEAVAQSRRNEEPRSRGVEKRGARAEERAASRAIRAESRGDVVPKASDKARGSADDIRGRALGRRYIRDFAPEHLKPAVRNFATSPKWNERMAAGAIARAHARGLRDDEVVLVTDRERVKVRNRKGDVLLDLDDGRARTLGRWMVLPLGDEVKSGAPSFCRSGAGHPVWGRQWCLDKGFGLGAERDLRWGRTDDIGDIVFRRGNTTGMLARDVLVSVLGETSFNRLALHAITLGLVEPLVGRWLGDDTGPRVLLLTAGGLPVAEVIDLDRNDRVDRLLVALRAW